MKNMKKKTYIESEIDKFLEKYEYGSKLNQIKSKFSTEKITKSLKKLRNKFINFSEFKEEYNKFMDNVKNFKDFKYNKKEASISKNQKKMERYARDLEYIGDLYNINQIVIQVKKVKD